MKELTSTLIFIFILSGCTKPGTVVKNPTPKDIEGNWEALNENDVLSYFLLMMSADGKGVVIAANEEAAGKIFDLHSFVSLERSFHIIGNL